MTDSSSSYGNFSSLASDYYTKVFASGARPVHASEQYADYGFIAVLGLAQRMGVRFLPITWQTALGRIGKGGQAGINEALANIQTSFAFKLLHRPQQHPFKVIAQEIVVLSHPVVRKHEHIVTLEGICWDIPEDDQVWPVLVFQKSHFGDLCKLSKLKRFKDLLIEDKLSLCADIGIAIRDMHHNSIVHGDVNPENVLIFEENSRIIAKVADFGFATCFQNHNDLISIPRKEPWNAPEHHARPFRSEQAKQMDIYSFGLLCFWLIFEAGSPDGLQLPPKMILESGESVNFWGRQPKKSLLQLGKDDRLTDLACWLVHEDSNFSNSMKDCLGLFFQSTLAFKPGSRCTDFELLLNLLVPYRDLPTTESFQRGTIPEQEDFQITPSIREFYRADFRLREFIINGLESIVSGPAGSTVQRVLPAKAALQLALSYTIGFGTIKNDNRAAILLNAYSLGNADYQSHLKWIADDNKSFVLENTLFSLLERRGYIQYIDFPHYYRERQLLVRAEARLKHEIQSIQLVFSENHWLYLNLIFMLATINGSQGRWKEAERLDAEVMDTNKRVLGPEHPSTLTSMANLASTYGGQGRWKEAEELEVQVMQIKKEMLGAEHPSTLTSMADLASTYRDQGWWKEAEELQVQVMQTREKLLGIEHPDTLGSIANLASTYTQRCQ